MPGATLVLDNSEVVAPPFWTSAPFSFNFPGSFLKDVTWNNLFSG